MSSVYVCPCVCRRMCVRGNESGGNRCEVGIKVISCHFQNHLLCIWKCGHGGVEEVGLWGRLRVYELILQ